MLPQRLYRIFLRYAESNLVLEAAGGPLRDAEGRAIGQVSRLRLDRTRLIVEGRTSAERIGVARGTRCSWASPVASVPGTDLRDFTLDVPFEPGPFAIVSMADGQESLQPFDGFSAGRVARARWALALPFVATLMRDTGLIWRWKRRGDMGAREQVKEDLGLVPRSFAAEFEPETVPAPPCPFGAVTLVMPVHNAFALLREALDRVERHTDMSWRLILIEDASTEPELRDWLLGWADARADHVHLLCNDENQGFVRSVNRGFAAARAWPEDPVVLLNSDALVPAGWTTRLLTPLADPDVATVTPFSNDAEIFTVPVICQRESLRPGLGDALDAAAADLGLSGTVAPTGVGFCMALAPRFLARIPEFDEDFGRGYGEETDWCQKARAEGGRHVCATNLFVEHRGGASFGSVEKQKLLEKSAARIARRYPGYDAEVQLFVQNDPLSTARFALGLSWAALQREGPVPVYLGHAIGGGGEMYLQGRIARDIAAGGAAVVLRVGQRHRWKLELHGAMGVTSGVTDRVDVVRRLIARLPRREIVYSCGVGDRDAVQLPGLLLSLAGRGPEAVPGGVQPIEILFHDFFPISPSYTLLNENSVYSGLPVPGDETGLAHRYIRPDGERITLAAWQEAWGALVSVAERIVVFSPSSRELVAGCYPEAAERIEVRPHVLPGIVPRLERPDRSTNGAPVIGVLGNIGPQKGAGVLRALSRDLARSGAARLVVIGHLAPEFALAPPARVHGGYRLEDLPGLVGRYEIEAWLIPSIWPETFSFTTHEALATGLPVFCFDLGAQADAVRQACAAGAPGGVLPLPSCGVVETAELVASIKALTCRSETVSREFQDERA